MKKLFYLNLILLFTCFLPAKSQNSWNYFSYWDTLDFRPRSEYLIFEDTLDNIWQVGSPSKTIFNSPHSGNLSILTDSAHFYPDTCNDYFLIDMSPALEDVESYLTFYHRYDTDTLTDGGVIEISYDQGATWINIHDDIDYNPMGWPELTNHTGIPTDTIRGGIYGFSGNSGGWKYVELFWVWFLPVKSATDYYNALVRFRFVSDSINTSKEGWMIDDIVLKAYHVTALDDLHPSSITIAPIPTEKYINIYSDDMPLKECELRIYDLTGGLRIATQLLTTQIDIGALTSGVYYYQIENKSSIIKTGKLLKE